LNGRNRNAQKTTRRRSKVPSGRLAQQTLSGRRIGHSRGEFYAGTSSEIGSRLRAAVERANAIILQEALSTVERGGMASTITAAVILESSHASDLNRSA
jgi:hypothetical protein